MITDKKITDWIFYLSPNTERLGKSKYDDPKFLELNFPHNETFNNKFLTCSLEDFVSTFVWVFKDKFPWEYTIIQTGQMEWDDKNQKLIENTNKRKAQDIYPLEFVEDYDLVIPLLSLKIKFKKPQRNVTDWVEKTIKDKTYTKDISGEAIKYFFTDSVTESIEVTEEYLFLKINRIKISE